MRLYLFWSDGAPSDGIPRKQEDRNLLPSPPASLPPGSDGWGRGNGGSSEAVLPMEDDEEGGGEGGREGGGWEMGNDGIYTTTEAAVTT